MRSAPIGPPRALYFAVLAALSAAALLPPRAVSARPRLLTIQLLHLSGWQGQLDPVPVDGVGLVGGAAALSSYWRAERGARPATPAPRSRARRAAPPPPP